MAETTAGKMCFADTKKFGEIEGVTDKAWYTNSFHVPVEFDISIFDKIKIEGRSHKYCNAGHISYIELSAPPKNNVDVIESIVKHMLASDMGYVSVNFPTDFCLDCGLKGVVIEKDCPSCGSNDIERVRRITGYLSKKENFNKYKDEELKHRTTHDNRNTETNKERAEKMREFFQGK